MSIFHDLFDFFSSNSSRHTADVNPASGLPMINESIDVMGNPFGMDFHNEMTHFDSADSILGVNPPSGLPMMNDMLDIMGNLFGTDFLSNDNLLLSTCDSFDHGSLDTFGSDSINNDSWDSFDSFSSRMSDSFGSGGFNDW